MLFAYCLDPSLGRVDKDSLTQQTLMELLINGIENREKICGSKEEPEDIAEWVGVKLNEKQEVINITWGLSDIRGSINLEWLPSNVLIMWAYRNKLAGSIQLETLPPSMEYLNLSWNEFSGEISLRHLPEGLEVLYLQENQLSGPVDLTTLPAGLQRLSLGDNEFSGETDFSKLPESLTNLDILNTQLSGKIYLKEKKYGFKVDNSKVKVIITSYQP